MKHILFVISIMALLSSCTEDRELLLPTPEAGDTAIIHNWNFNNVASTESLLAPTLSAGGGALAYTAIFDAAENEGTALNAQNGAPAGSALRLRNPAGTFTMDLPTTGYRHVVLSFAAMRTTNGAQENLLSYSTDGVNFVSAGLAPFAINVTTEFKRYVFNFSNIGAANDNPNFKVRIDYNVGHTNDSGNNRYDNITLEGEAL